MNNVTVSTRQGFSEMEDRLRVLVLQHYYTSRDFTAVSMFNVYRTLFWANKDRMSMMLEVPRNYLREWVDSFVKYDLTEEELKEINLKYFGGDVEFLRTARAREYKEWEVFIPTEEQHMFLRKYLKNKPIDVLLNGEYGLTAIIRVAMEEKDSRYYSKARVPVIHYQHETWADYLSMQILGRGISKMMLIMNAVAADQAWFLHEADMELFLSEARNKLSSGLYVELKKKSRVARPLYPYHEIDGLYEVAEERRRKRLKETGKIRFFYAGSPEKKKRIHVFAKVYGLLKESGRINSDFVVVMSGEHGKVFVKQNLNYDGVEHLYSLPRKKLIEAMMDIDVVPCLSIYYGTGLVCLEAVALGALPIYWDETHTKYRVPDGYPLIVSSEKELEEALELVSDVNEYFRLKEEWGDRLVEFTRRKYGYFEARRQYEMMKKLYYDFVSGFNEKDIPLWDAVRDAAELITEEVTDEKLWSLVSAITKSGKSVKYLKSVITEIGLRILARKFGLVDVGGHKEVRWVRAV